MPIVLSQVDYWTLFKASNRELADADRPVGNDGEGKTLCNFPSQLGRGQYLEFDLRGGTSLAIADYHLHDDIAVRSSERPHCLEYSFFLPSENGSRNNYRAGEYRLWGSGTAPSESYCLPGNQQIRYVNVHIAPEQFHSFLGTSEGDLPSALSHLLPECDRLYYSRSGTTTPAMNLVLQQMLTCGYRGLMRRMYLESKVWELMALLIERETTAREDTVAYPPLKGEDADRIYQAREILRANLDRPPSLLELARQVGLNDYTLKVGFRQVFKTTAFGCLRQLRLERARQLLSETDMAISEVARSVGFANRGYFAASFRKKFGVNPKCYAMSQRNSV